MVSRRSIGRLGCLIPVLGILVYAAYWGVQFYKYGVGQRIGHGYAISGATSDDIYVYKDGEIVIAPTVIEWTTASEYFVGLLMPAQHLECDGGAGYKIRVTNQQYYAILNMSSNDVSILTSREEFEDALEELDIAGEADLDYSKFQDFWDRYSGYYENINFSNCTPIDVRDVGSSVE